MIVAAKVWEPALEAEPEGLFNPSSCPTAPPNWFREEPDYAAELFGLERGPGRREIHIIDTVGVLHKFSVNVERRLDAQVRPL